MVLTVFLALGRVAHVAAARADAALGRHRDARVGDGDLRRQDRHAHHERHDGPRARGRRIDPRARRTSRSRSRSTRSPSSRCSPRPSIRSIRWTGRSGTSADTYLAGTEHLHGDWDAGAGVPAVGAPARPLARLALARPRRLRHRGQGGARGDRRPVPPRRLSDARRSHGGRSRRPRPDGLRVLAVARARFSHARRVCPPSSTTSTSSSSAWPACTTRCGPASRDAVAECARAGVRVVMITGDYPGTALAIAREIGLDAAAGCITGPELEAMSDDELARRGAAR